MSRNCPLNRFALAFACVVPLFATGCSSVTRDNAPVLASVEIHNHSLEDIVDAARAVFIADGYEGLMTSQDLVFEKKGSKWQQVEWGGWFGDDKVAVHAVLEPVTVSDTVYRLDCKAWMVRSAGDPLFEEDVPMKHLKPKPFEQLLAQIADRLK